jgi:hypothetical protein
MTLKKRGSISLSPPPAQEAAPGAFTISLSLEETADHLWNEYERAKTSSTCPPDVQRLKERLVLLTQVMIRNLEKARLETEPGSTEYYSICRKLADLYHDLTLVDDAAHFKNWNDKRDAMLEVGLCKKILFDRVYEINIDEIPVFSIVNEDQNLIIADRSLRFFTLKREWLYGSGIGQRITTRDGKMLTDTRLYLRPRCISLIKFTIESLKNRDTVDLIVGQPGTGKSLLAFLAGQILSVHHDADVLWVHIHKRKDDSFTFSCIVMHANSRSTVLFDSVEPLLTFIVGDWGIDSPHDRLRVMFIDGYVDEPPLGTVNAKALGWLESDSRKNRLIFLSSMCSISNLLTKDDELLFDIRIFRQWSWRYIEYEEALENDEFRNSLAQEIDPRTKYFYAGGCARFMFQFDTSKVKSILDRSLERLAHELSQGNVCTSAHSLLSVFEAGQHEFVSEYVRERINELPNAADLLAFVGRFKRFASRLK